MTLKELENALAAHVSSYLTWQGLVFGHETPSWPFREWPVARLSEQLSVHWLPLQHCQVQEPPADQRRVTEAKTQSTEVRKNFPNTTIYKYSITSKSPS